MANEKRLIDADEAKKIIKANDWTNPAVPIAVGMIIDRLPTVDATPIIHGFWIEHKYAEEENGLLVPNYECSVCHSWERDEGYYCPNCGAKMDGERKDND